MKKILSLSVLLFSCGGDPVAQKKIEPFLQVAQSAPATEKNKQGDKPPEKPVKKTVTIAAVGDILPHGPVKDSAARQDIKGADGKSINNDGYNTLFDRAMVGFTDADIGFANLETNVAPKNDRGSRPFVFNAPLGLLNGLKFFEADVLSFANNHSYDQGRPAFAETIDNIIAAGLIPVGAGKNQAEAYEAKIVEKNGLKICFMGQARLLNGNLQPKSEKEPQLMFVPYGKDGVKAKVKAIEAIKEKKKGCDYLLMSIHWGIEYDTVPHGDDKAWTKEQLEAGVDGILGHHAHVLQPLEEYTTKDGRKTFVSYSMSNFVSNQQKAYNKTPVQKAGHPRDSMILRVTVKHRDDGTEGQKGVLESVGYYPAWTDRQTRPDEPNLPVPMIRAVVVDQELKDAEKAITALKAKATLTAEEEKALKQWQARFNEFTARRKEIVKVVGEKYVLPLP